MLFLGLTGSGKTRIVEATAECLLGDSRAVVTIDCAEFRAAEMSALLSPRLGFAAHASLPQSTDQLDEKIGRSAEEAAGRNFSPEFINRIDKIVTFKPLGTNQLRQILDIELKTVQQRIFLAGPQRSFVFTASDPAKELLLTEGLDAKDGARHLKRAIERLLVQSISNLIATDQVRRGDCIRVDLDRSMGRLHFVRESEGFAGRAMLDLAGIAPPAPAMAMSSSAPLEAAKIWKRAFFK